GGGEEAARRRPRGRFLALDVKSAGGADEVGVEEGAAPAEALEDVARRTGAGERRLRVAAGGGEEPGEVVAHDEGDRCGPRRAEPASPRALDGRLRGDHGLGAPRGEARPRDLAGEAQLVEPLRPVAGDPGRADPLLPPPP